MRACSREISISIWNTDGVFCNHKIRSVSLEIFSTVFWLMPSRSARFDTVNFRWMFNDSVYAQLEFWSKHTIAESATYEGTKTISLSSCFSLRKCLLDNRATTGLSMRSMPRLKIFLLQIKVKKITEELDSKYTVTRWQTSSNYDVRLVYSQNRRWYSLVFACAPTPGKTWTKEQERSVNWIRACEWLRMMVRSVTQVYSR